MTMAHGKVTIVCRVPDRGSTRQRTLPRHRSGRAQKFAVGQVRHMAKALPCARNIAHGKGCLCRWPFAVCPLPCAAHGKTFAVGFSGFAVCFGHTANKASPVVIDSRNHSGEPLPSNAIMNFSSNLFQ